MGCMIKLKGPSLAAVGSIYIYILNTCVRTTTTDDDHVSRAVREQSTGSSQQSTGQNLPTHRILQRMTYLGGKYNKATSLVLI